MPTKIAYSILQHEADHAAALWMLLGPDSVRHISCVPDAGCAGVVKLGELPPERSFALNCADLAVALAAPSLDPRLPVNTEPDGDWLKIEVCCEGAYRSRPVSDVDADDFKAAWLRAVFARASELVDSARFRKLRAALEVELLGNYYLGAERIRAVFAEVDA